MRYTRYLLLYSVFSQVVLKGDKKKKQFVAFYIKDNNVKAVAAFGRPPQAIAASELFRLRKCVIFFFSSPCLHSTY